MKMAMMIAAAVAVAIIAVSVMSAVMTRKPESGKMGKALTESPDPVSAPPSQEGVKPGYWKVEKNVELFYFSDGRGAPVLVLHGGPGLPSREPWKGLALLGSKYTFYYYQQRGCGKSSRPFDRFEGNDFNGNMQALVGVLGLDQQIADVERIRRILGKERLVIVGHSFGGFTAALYAAKFPDRVEKLVLFSPADVLVMPPADGGLYERVGKALPPGGILDEYKEYLRRFFDFGTIFSRNESELAALNNEFTTYYFAALKNQGVSFSDDAIYPEDTGGWLTPALFFSLGRSYDRRKELAAITCPVLIITGGRDITESPDGPKGYRENIRNCTVEIIPDAGHHTFNERPEAVARILSGFLEKLAE